jgi:uncharacterized protein (TIGR00369 family)
MNAEKMDKRSRTFTWEDPDAVAKAGEGLNGLERSKKIIAGELPPPPVTQLIGFRLVEVDAGFAVFEFLPEEFHYNPIGSLHGGIPCTLIDAAMGAAVQTTMPEDVWHAMVEIKVNFLKKITRETGRMRCEGRVIHSGKRLAMAQGQLKDEKGVLYSHGTGTAIIFR